MKWTFFSCPILTLFIKQRYYRDVWRKKKSWNIHMRILCVASILNTLASDSGAAAHAWAQGSVPLKFLGICDFTVPLLRLLKMSIDLPSYYYIWNPVWKGFNALTNPILVWVRFQESQISIFFPELLFSCYIKKKTWIQKISWNAAYLY